MDPEARIKAYLDANRGSLRFASIDEIVQQVKLFVFYGNSPISDDEVKKVVARWAIFNPVRLTPDPTTGSAPTPGSAKSSQESAFLDAAKKAVSTLVDGVSIGPKGSNLTIAATGATAKLTQGERALSLGVSWGGAFKLEAKSGPFHFSGSIAQDKWEITLSFPQDTYVPDLSTLGKVFAEGERAVRNIVAAAADRGDVAGARKDGALIKQHMGAVESAVEAASGIAKADRTGGWSFGFKANSPEPGPGEQGIRPGVEVLGVVTWWF